MVLHSLPPPSLPLPPVPAYEVPPGKEEAVGMWLDEGGECGEESAVFLIDFGLQQTLFPRGCDVFIREAMAHFYAW